ncbi:MAG TPA: hypothetical protein VK968_04885, partial [Roseimicrobium sp.]|nr:hypothetical protein [Roseimicrobium sp.]
MNKPVNSCVGGWIKLQKSTLMKLSILLPIVLKTVFLVTFAFLLTEKPAHAYLDPGTGSYATQVLIAGLAGAAFAIKNLLLRFTRNR